MKRFTIILLAFLAIISGCSGAGRHQESIPDYTPPVQAEIPETQIVETQVPAQSVPEPIPVNNPEIRRLSIVCAIFPQYDWIREILGSYADNFDITLLMDNRIDLHSYQPTFDDIITIATSDLFIHVGGISDMWVEDVLKQAVNTDMTVINMLDLLGDAVKMEFIPEGMEHDCDDDCDDASHNHDSGHDHEDEHVWLSLQMVKTLCAAIAAELSLLYPDGAEYFHDNLNAYLEKLTELDREYQKTVDSALVNTLVFADRFPFRYLMDDYGLYYYAAFSGCSAETEASFSTIVFLATKVEELKLKYVMVTETADKAIAETVISSTPSKNQEILTLNAMQSITRNDIDSGMTYLSIMEDNLQILKMALS